MTGVPRRVLVAAMLGAVLVLSACGGQQPGSAATLGDSRITEQQLTDQMREVFTAQGLPVDSADAALTSTTLGRMIVIDLLDTLSERAGIVITQGRIDEQLAAYIAEYGDESTMEFTFAQQGVAPSQIEGVIRLNLQAQDLGVRLAPEGTAEEQGAALFTAASALSEELDVTTSPRFGTWDPTTLQVGPVPDDLSTPPSLEQ